MPLHRRTIRTNRRGLFGALALVAFFGCSSDDETGKALAQSCTLDSDCAASLLCSFGRCHTACSTSKDCRGAARCIKTTGQQGACTLDEEARCARNTDCNEPLVCGVDAKCRNECEGDRDCLSNQRCVQGNVCADPSELNGDGKLPAVLDGGLGGASTGGRGAGGAVSITGGRGGSGGNGGGGAGGDTREGGPPLDGGSTDSSTRDGSTGQTDAMPGYTRCPPSPPVLPSLCKDGLHCTYGTDSRVSCRTTYDCIGETWSVAMPKCTVVTSCETQASPPANATACATGDDWCEFADHTTCACQLSSRRWACAPRPLFPCPTVPPNAGQPCDASAASRCAYGVCGAASLISSICSAGTWSFEPIVCGL